MENLLVLDGQTTGAGKDILKRLFDYLEKENREADLVELTPEDCYEDCIPFFLSSGANAVITCDMAGFHTLNQEGESVFNSMYCKCFHILTKEPWCYPDELLKRMNFDTILVVSEEQEKTYIERFYENVLHVEVCEALTKLRQNGMEEKEDDIRMEQLPKVFRVMGEEILKNWKPGNILLEEIEKYIRKTGNFATEGELTEACFLFRDIPKQAEKGLKKEMSEEEKLQTLDEVTMFIISAMREG